MDNRLITYVKSRGYMLESEYAAILDEFYKHMSDIRYKQPPNIATWQPDGEWYEIVWYGKFLIILEPDMTSPDLAKIEVRVYNDTTVVHEFTSYEELYNYMLENEEMKPYFTIEGNCKTCNCTADLLHGICEACDDALR